MPSTPSRKQILNQLADLILHRKSPVPFCVGIDGIDCAGKSTLADELETVLKSRGERVARMSIDRFLHPHAKRYEKGKLSPDGYYRDSFDYDAARTAIEANTADRILLFEGVFLFRPELNKLWNYRIFVDISFEACLARALDRDRLRFGDVETTRRRYECRYIPGQRIYLAEVRPNSLADVIVHNDEPRDAKLSLSAL